MALTAAPAAAYTSFVGAGGNNTSVTPTSANAAMTAFEAAIGGANNGISTGPLATGFRTVNWDGVPDAVSTPNLLPPAFFNSTSPRGMLLTTPGFGVEVSASSGTGVGFGNINGGYPAAFPAFSPAKVFSPVGRNVTEVSFFVPGTGVHASVQGFGAIFRNVENGNASSIEYLEAGGQSLGKFYVAAGPASAAEFLGVLFPSNTVARVVITTGTTPLGPSDSPPSVNVVALDDFAYAEPQPIPGPTLSIASPAEGASVASSPATVSGTASDPTGILALTVDGHGVPVAADGTWSTQATLSAGPNTIDVVATGVGGNSTEARRSVTLAPSGGGLNSPAPIKECMVPKLRGKSLRAARKALAAAHCSAGKVARKHAAGRPGRVIGQKPGPGKRLAESAPVALTVSKR